jgi:regulator of replication initiation timing
MSKYSNHPLVETLSKRINELVVETHTMRSTHNRTLNELSLVTMRYAKLRDRFKELLYHVPEAVRRQPRFATEDDDESMHLAASRIVYEKYRIHWHLDSSLV